MGRMGKVILVILVSVVMLDLGARAITVWKQKSLTAFTFRNNFYEMFSVPTKYDRINPFLVMQPYINSPFNKEGYRSDHSVYAEKKPGDVRIFFFGGSTTANETRNVAYSQALEKLVNRGLPDGSRAVTFNAARPAYSTNQSVVRLATEAVFREPDIVVLMQAYNDMHELFFNQGEFHYPRDAKYFHARYFPFLPTDGAGERTLVRKVIENPLLNQHRALNLFFGRLSLAMESNPVNSQKEIPEQTIQAGLNEYKGNLRSVVALAASRGADCIFLSQPMDFDRDRYLQLYERVGYAVNYPTLEQFIDIHRRYTAAMEEVARETGSTYIPMKERFESLPGPRSDYFYDSMHYTEKGIESFATLAEEDLRSLVVARIEKAYARKE